MDVAPYSIWLKLEYVFVLNELQRQSRHRHGRATLLPNGRARLPQSRESEASAELISY